MNDETYDQKKYETNILNLGLEESSLATKSKDVLEAEVNIYQPEMPIYGGLPYFEKREEFIAGLVDEKSGFF